MIKAFVFYLLWLLAVFILNIFLQSSGAFVLLLLSICLPLLTVLIYTVFTPKIKAEMKLFPKIIKGEKATAQLLLQNKSIFPLARLSFKLVCKNMLTGEEAIISIKTSVFRASESLIKINAEYCGKLVFFAKDIKAYSPFLLSFRRAKLVINETTLVMPSLNLKSNNISAFTNNCGDETHTNEKGVDMSEAFGYREYIEGDLQKNIHRKLTQKLGKTIVKEGSKQSSENAVVLFETSVLQTPQPSECDFAAEQFFAMEKLLVKQQIEHIAAWKNHETGKYYIFNVKSENDIALLLPKLLSSPIIKDEKSAIDYFNQSKIHMNNAQIIIISPFEQKG